MLTKSAGLLTSILLLIVPVEAFTQEPTAPARDSEVSREAAERSAVMSLRTLNTANFTYRASYDEFAADFRTLVEEFDLDRDLLEVKNGYRFEYSLDGDSGYQFTAEPRDRTWRHFFTGTDAVIRVEEGRPATSKSLPAR